MRRSPAGTRAPRDWNSERKRRMRQVRIPHARMRATSTLSPETGRKSGNGVGRVLPGPAFLCASTIRRRAHPTTRAWSPPFPRERGRRRLVASTRPPRPRTFPRERPAVPPGPPRRRAARPDTGRRPSPGRGRPPTPPPRPFRLRLPDAARRSARPPRPSRRPLRQLTRRRLHLPLRPARRPIPRPRGPTPALAAPGRTPPPAPAAAPTRPPASTAPGRPPSRPRPPTSAARGSPAGAVPPCVAARGSAGRALLVRAARTREVGSLRSRRRDPDPSWRAVRHCRARASRGCNPEGAARPAARGETSRCTAPGGRQRTADCASGLKSARASQGVRKCILGICNRRTTQSGGMQRRSKAAGLSPRAARANRGHIGW